MMYAGVETVILALQVQGVDVPSHIDTPQQLFEFIKEKGIVVIDEISTNKQ